MNCIAEEVYLKINYDLKNDLYYWELGKYLESNESMENFIKDNFANYIKSKKNKRRSYIYCLTYLFTHLFSLIEDLDNDELEQLMTFQSDIDFINEIGYGLRFSRSKQKTISYPYGNRKVTDYTLRKTLTDLEKLGIVLLIVKGHNCYNNGGNTSNYELGMNYFNWEKIYDLYLTSNIETQHLNEAYEPTIIIKKPTFIKKKRTTKKKYEPTNEYDYLIEENEELKQTKTYLQRLYDMYSSMKVELSTYEEAPKVIQEEIDNLILEQKYKRERMNDSYVYQLDYDSEVKKWNKYLSQPKKPKRIYHFDNDSLSWGRVYGNFIDNVPNLYKPLLLINGEQTISIDIKSTLLQLYVLNYHKDVPNKQDFYEYEGLKGIIDRDHIKLLSQCLNYNETLSKALVSYNNSCFTKLDSSHSLKKDDFNKIIETMREERPYLFGLFMNTDTNKQMIHQESCFIREVSSILMDLGISHILNFDAIYTTKSNFTETLNLFEDVSTNLYGRPINIDWNKDIYPNPIHT